MPTYLRFLAFILFSIGILPAQAQVRTCGTPPPTPRQVQIVAADQARLAAERIGAANASATAPIPVQIWVVRTDAGVGLSVQEVLNAFTDACYYHRANGLSFYLTGPIQFVNSTALQTVNDKTGENALCNGRDNANAVNVYMGITTLNNGTACGYAYINYPGYSINTRLLLACPGSMTHELGHTFGLFHPHDNNNASDLSLRERVPRTNCTTAGDLLCDTPADPYGLTGATASNCVYAGTAVDADGVAYTNPLLSNSMSYWNCGETFTAQQGSRVQYVRNTHLTITTAYPARPAVTLTVSGQATGIPMIDWTTSDAASLGYFIERKGPGDTAFAVIGAVQRIGQSYGDSKALGNATYTYRLRNLENPDILSNEVTVTTGVLYCIPNLNGYSNNCNTPPIAIGSVSLKLSSTATALFTRATDSCQTYSYYTPSGGSTLAAGQAYTLSTSLILASGSYYPQYIAAYVDYNRDGVFAATERVFLSANGNNTQTATFTVPSTVASGQTRLRIRSQYTGNSNLDPCLLNSWGETEDYLITLRGNCTKPAALAVDAGSNKLRAYPRGTGLSYQWYLGASAIGGATDTVYTITASGSYRVHVTTSANGGCDSLSAAVNATYTAPAAPLAWQWVRRSASSGTDRFNRVRTAPSGDHYAAGAFSGTCTFDGKSGSPSTLTYAASGGTDGMLCKYSKSGTLSWVARFGGTGDDEALGLATDKFGYAYVSGFFTGSMTIKTTSADTTLVSAGGMDMFVCKIHPSTGARVFCFRMGSTGNDRAEGIDVAPDLRFYVAGSFIGNTAIGGKFGTVIPFTSRGNSDAFLAKFSDLGSLYWAIQGGGTGNDFGYGAAADISGGGYLMGSYESTATFNSSLGGTTPISKTVVGGSDGFVLGVSVTGQLNWVASMGGTTNENVRDLAPDPRGTGVVAVGGFSNSAAFGPTNLTATGFYDAFAVRLTNAGAFEWAQKSGGFGQDQAWGVRLDRQGNPFVAISISQSAYFFGSSSSSSQYTSQGGQDGILVKLAASTGLPLLYAHVSGAAGDEQCRSVDTAAEGGAVAAGYLSGGTTFGALGPFASTGGTDGFVARYSTASSAAREGLDEPSPSLAQAGYRAVPNPASGSFVLMPLSGNPTDAPAEARLLDAQGRLVLTSNQAPGKPVSIGSLPKGLYMWQAGGHTGRVVVE